MAQRSMLGRFFAAIAYAIDLLMRWTARLIFLVFALIILLAIFGGSESPKFPIDAYLQLNPKGAIVEVNTLANPSELLLGGGGVSSTLLKDITGALERAAEDEGIKGVVLDLSEMTSISPANLETVGKALEVFAASGKPMIAYGESFTQQQYFLASYADTVYLHDMGQILLTGYGGSQLFYARLLEKLGVNVHIFRVGTHKAAVEPYMLNEMSAESRQNNQSVVDDLWARYVNQLAQNRGLTEEQVASYANDFAAHLAQFGGSTAQVALELDLVDSLVTAPQWREERRAQMGGSKNAIGLQEYVQSRMSSVLPKDAAIGVIVAQGQIDIGEQPRGRIGADNLVGLIRQARRDDDIKALVLRVDSPGGSALASEIIRQELDLLQASGKPLVVSMGGTAASGGYWISAMADEIWASPATITGSIGIYGMIPTFEGTLDKIGMNADGIGTTPLSRADNFAGMTPQMEQIFQASVENGYRQFLNLVATGRSMSLEEVDLIAQGQVWSGEKALELGLVDALGDLPDAVAAAASLAQVSDYEWRYIERVLSPGEQLMQQILGSFDVSALVASVRRNEDSVVDVFETGPLGRVLEEVQLLGNFNDPRNLYLQCELCSSVR